MKILAFSVIVFFGGFGCFQQTANKDVALQKVREATLLYARTSLSGDLNPDTLGLLIRYLDEAIAVDSFISGLTNIKLNIWLCPVIIVRLC